MSDTQKKKLQNLSAAQIRQLMARRKKPAPAGTFKMPRNPDGIYPVSKGQERFWFLSLLSEDPALYNIPIAVSLKQDEIDKTALEERLNGLIAKHAILRSSFFEDGGTVYQKIHPRLKVNIDYMALEHGLTPAEQLQQATKIGIEHGRQAFDAAQLPLLRMMLVKARRGQYFLFLSLHHLISDGWTNAMIAQALTQGDAAPNRHDDLQYIDYVNWETKWLAGPDHENQRQFWRRVLDNLPPAFRFPRDFHLSDNMEQGSTLSLDLPAGLHQRVTAFCQDRGATPFQFYMTCYAILLARYADTDDLIIGTPVANRESRHFQYMFGLFINSLPMRFSLDRNAGFADLLAANKDRIDTYLKHQKIPVSTLMQSVDAPYSSHENPLYSVHFAYQYFPQTQEKDAFVPLTLDYGLAKFDLNLWVEIYGDTRKLSVTFRKNRFSPQKINQFLQHYIRLIEYSIDNPNHRPAVSEFDTKRMQSCIASAPLDLASDCWLDHYLHAVKRMPDNIALIDQQGRLDYRELDGMVCRLAQGLKQGGISKGDIVILQQSRGRNFIIGLLACLRIGAVYLPVDENIAPERITRIISGSQAKILLSPTPREDIKTLDIAAAMHPDPVPTTMPRDPSIGGQDSACIIYTSGTSGNPKGVVITHHGLANHFASMQQRINTPSLNGFLHLSAIDADLGNTMIYMALGSGSYLVMPDKDHLLDPVLLTDFLAENPVDILKIAPSHLQSFADAMAPVLPAKILILAGEPLPASLARRIFDLRPDLRLFNSYGPTEATISISLHELDRGSERPTIPVGTPLANTQIHILGKDRQPLPRGCTGEVHIAGASLAAGYLGNPQLTAEKFITLPRPLAIRLYATGDMGFIDMAGELVLTGRRDRQVKINGFRIEPAEIEAVLSRNKTVKAAAVWPQQTEQGPRLQAAIVPNGDCPAPALKADLAQYFHPALIPALHFVDTIPTTGNGKTDFDKLAAQTGQPAQLQDITQPRDITELRLWEIFRDILGRTDIALDVSFFDLGGHSLQAASLLAQVNRTLQQNIRVSALVRYPTVQDLACHIRTLGKTDPPLVALTDTGKARKLFWVHPAGGNIMNYLTIARLMADRYDTSAFVATDDTAHAPRSIVGFAQSYVAALPSVAKGAVPILAGWSMGALIAHQMAIELQQKGHRPPLVLIDQPALPDNRDAKLSFDERIANYLSRVEVFTGKPLKDCRVRNPNTGHSVIDHSLLHREFIRVGLAPPDVSLPAFRTFLDLLIFHNKIVGDFTPARYDGPVLLIRASQQLQQGKGTVPVSQDLGWGAYCSDLTIVQTPGNHMTVLNNLHGAKTAAAIDQWLQSQGSAI